MLLTLFAVRLVQSRRSADERDVLKTRKYLTHSRADQQVPRGVIAYGFTHQEAIEDQDEVRGSISSNHSITVQAFGVKKYFVKSWSN